MHLCPEHHAQSCMLNEGKVRWSGLDTEQINDAGSAFYDVTINLDAHTETTGKQQPGNRAAGVSPATVSILHPHAPFPTVPEKVTRPQATPSHPAHSREICAQKHTRMSQGHHLLTSGPRATEHFQHACPHWAPGIEAALGCKGGKTYLDLLWRGSQLGRLC